MPEKSKGSKWSGDFDAKEHKGRFGKPVSGKGKDGNLSKRGGTDPKGDRSKAAAGHDRAGGKERRVPGDVQSGDGRDSDSKGKDAKGKKGKGVRIEPHESGEGSRAHFHPEVSADLNGEADYKHHVTEHAKHYAGYLTHKDKDPERGEAHRQAANLHARVGNALHAGGDTKPAPPPPVMFGPPGQGGAGGAGGPPGSPGKDAMGRPLPGAPDGKRNPPGQDSAIGAQRRAGGAAGGAAGQKGGQGKPPKATDGPPMQLVGKGLYFGALSKGGERAGHKYLSRRADGKGGYVYTYPGQRTATSGQVAQLGEHMRYLDPTGPSWSRERAHEMAHEHLAANEGHTPLKLIETMGRAVEREHTARKRYEAEQAAVRAPHASDPLPMHGYDPERKKMVPVSPTEKMVGENHGRVTPRGDVSWLGEPPSVAESAAYETKRNAVIAANAAESAKPPKKDRSRNTEEGLLNLLKESHPHDPVLVRGVSNALKALEEKGKVYKVGRIGGGYAVYLEQAERDKKSITTLPLGARRIPLLLVPA